jgi:hypothetical protein
MVSVAAACSDRMNSSASRADAKLIHAAIVRFPALANRLAVPAFALSNWLPLRINNNHGRSAYYPTPTELNRSLARAQTSSDHQTQKQAQQSHLYLRYPRRGGHHRQDGQKTMGSYIHLCRPCRICLSVCGIRRILRRSVLPQIVQRSCPSGCGVPVAAGLRYPNYRCDSGGQLRRGGRFMKIISLLGIATGTLLLSGPVRAIPLISMPPTDQSLVQQTGWYGPPGYDWETLDGLWYSPGVGPHVRCVDVRYGCADRWGWDGKGRSGIVRNSPGFNRCVRRHGC